MGLHQARLFPCERGARRCAPPFGRTLSAAPDRRGENRHRGDRAGSQIGRRIAAARRGGRHRIHGRRHGAHLRPEDRLDGRRTDQDVGHLQRRHVGAGRIFPQGAAHALGRRAGNPHQDRRPAAQHAHAGRHAPEQADQDHQRDDLPLRAAGVQTGAFRHQNRTGRPLHEVPFSGAVRGDQPQTGRDGGVAPGVHRTLQRSDRRSAAARRHQFRDFGPCQEHLLDLDEDAAQTDSFRRGLRSVRHPHRLQTAALPVGKDAVLPDLRHDHGHLHAQARPPARLDQHPESQRLRGAALDGDEPRRRMGRGADPHAAHGRHSRKGSGRPLEVQAGDHFAERGRAGQVAQKDPRCAQLADRKRRRLSG